MLEAGEGGGVMSETLFTDEAEAVNVEGDTLPDHTLTLIVTTENVNAVRVRLGLTSLSNRGAVCRALCRQMTQRGQVAFSVRLTAPKTRLLIERLRARFDPYADARRAGLFCVLGFVLGVLMARQIQWWM